MKVVIFAGGIGSRISEESHLKPKPMIEIGGKPILWHIMKIYEKYGHNEFIICLGYKGYVIKEYFMNHYMHNADFTIDLAKNNIEYHRNNTEKFKVTLVETGPDTSTAGRLKQVEPYIQNETFLLTYGDGVSDVNINEVIDFHKKNEKVCTVTAVQNPGKFGSIVTDEDGIVSSFMEKPKGDGMWINGGFFVLEPQVFKYLQGDMTQVMWEDDPMKNLSLDGQLAAFKYHGFWKCMDALRDKNELEAYWNSGHAKWKVW